MEGDNKTYKKKKEKKQLGKRDLIQGDRNLLGKEFDFGSRIISRFALCTLLVGCFCSYPLILVSNLSYLSHVKIGQESICWSHCYGKSTVNGKYKRCHFEQHLADMLNCV